MIVVVGSLNMDLVARVERLPRPGETVHGEELARIPGGKGANQAVAIARLGGQATMIGRVGDDGFGVELRQALASYNVDAQHVLTTENCGSGVAIIGVERSGENAITIVAGANGRLSVDDVRRQESVIASASALVVQLEVPVATVSAAVEIARRHGVLTVLDPAPAPCAALPSELLQVDVLTPNQTEAEALTGMPVRNLDNALTAAHMLRNAGARQVVIKMGALGALLIDEQCRAYHAPAFMVAVVDTTAAGDAFTAGLTVALTEGHSLADTGRFACAAGALATTKLGAQPAMPARSQVDALLNAES